MTTNYYGSDAVATAARIGLTTATSIPDLLDLGIERGFTLWPEWGPTFTELDKRIENRPSAPPKNLVGKRVAFHNGTYLGGRKAIGAAIAGIYNMLRTAQTAGWNFAGELPSRGEHGRRGADRRGRNDVHLGSGTLAKGDKRVAFDGSKIPLAAITFTAIITGFELPTDSPAHPWQFASDPADPDSFSYGWHVAEVIVLATPIPCSGLQGFWPLKTAKVGR